MNDMALAAAFNALGHDGAVDVLANALAQSPEFIGVLNGFDRQQWAMGQVPQDVVHEAVSSSVMRLLEPLMPALGAKLNEVAGPATEKAMAVAIPKLKAQIPLFAAISGIVAGILVVAGMYLSKKL